MTLTRGERGFPAPPRRNPPAGAQSLADALGATRAAARAHLSRLVTKRAVPGRGHIPRQEHAVVVIGGANVDIKVRSLAPVALRTSNPGRSHTSPGGVARNVAENLARLGTPTHLIAAVGQDAAGERLLTETRAAGVRVDHVRRGPHPTGTYTAVLDADGDLLVAVADMAATDALSPKHLRPARELIGHAGMLVLDGNLSPRMLSYVLDIAATTRVQTLIDPVSAPKAALLAPLFTARRPVFALTPNAAELGALTGRDLDPAAGRDDRELIRAVAVLHERGVRHVWVRLGARGSLLSTEGEDRVPLDAPPAEVHDATGAGDAMLGAFGHALLTGADPVGAARYGHAAAALTVATSATVRPDLTPRLIEDALNAPQRRSPWQRPTPG
ncbi:carbohydrate kinase family protein [Streptomyces hygroscopicus]|uniref:carbohydrate kinase family protein n=1 Tax=Streptomyces hygroscopicus TaxID=1912 RepID=UPI00368838C1